MSVQFVNISRKTFLSKSILFKVVPIERVDSTIGLNPYLWFANPILWNDPFEKRFIEVLYKDNNGTSYGYPLKGRVFCTCFSSTRINEAQWMIYSIKSECICLKVKREKLLEELEKYLTVNPNDKIYIGRVEYQETKSITGALSKNPIFTKSGFSLNNQETLIKLLLLKRNSFLFEEEFRIFIVKPEPCNSDGIKFNYSCCSTDLVESITLHPLCVNTGIEKKLIQETKNGGYGFTPFKNNRGRMQIRVYKSHLYNYKHPKYIKI